MRTQTFFSGTVRQSALGVSLAAIAMLLSPPAGLAQNALLNDGGSAASFNLGAGTGGTGPIGMNSWSVFNGQTMQNQLNQQWFWYSINGGAMQSIDQIGGLTSSDNGSTLSAVYQNSTIAVQVSYTLQGDGINSGGGTLTESVNVFNVSQGNFNINFYQYANFNLWQSDANIININGGPGAYSSIIQTTTANGNGIQETVGQPPANFAEAGSPSDVMGDVTAGNQLNGNTYFGPADAAWGLEWSSTLSPFNDNPGNAWNVLQGETMSITPSPEPGTIALIALGGLTALGCGRRSCKCKA
jgi:hypothetical protein